MALSVQSELETVFGQLVSFSLTNVTMQESLDKILIAQQASKHSIETAKELKKVQQIQGVINRIRKEGEKEEENLLREAKQYYNMQGRTEFLSITKEKALNDIYIIKNKIASYFFSKEKLNKFCWYKKVSLLITKIDI